MNCYNFLRILESVEVYYAMGDTQKKLGLGGLTAIVVGAMIGAGIFNIAQNMAVGAGAGAVAVAWAVTAVGMLCLVLTFKRLTERFPELDSGIYEYARAGFGNYAGFNVAWGYWLCVAVGNVAYAVMLNDSLGAFFPVLLRHSWPTALTGAVLIWGMFMLVRTGLRTAAVVNSIMAVLKFTALLLVVVVLVVSFRYGVFIDGFWSGQGTEGVGEQVRSTMMVTLWCFLGIEGAVMLASKARRPGDVGRAGVLGLLLAWFIYVLVSLLCYGVMSRAELSGLTNPSVAYVMRSVCGDWAYYFVLVAIILSLAGGWLAWTLLVSQIPYGAAECRMLPRQFMQTNRNGVPVFGLLASSIFMTVFMVVVCTAGDVYLTALSLTSVMVLPAYLTSGLYLFKVSLPRYRVDPGHRKGDIVIAGLTVVYCLWLLYAAGLLLLLASSLFYLLGVPFYVMARRQYRRGASDISVWRLFNNHEKSVLALLVVCGIVSAVLLFTGRIAF